MPADKNPTGPSSKKVLHGHDAVFVPDLDKKYTCPVCLVGLRDPIQTKCGHRFCKTCLEHSRGKCRYGRCPVDNTWYDPKRHLFEDNATKREVLSLTVECDNHTDGCRWTSELREREEHLTSCPHGSVACPNDCKHVGMRKDVESHLKKCPKRLEACQQCGEDIQASELTKHQLLVCGKFPVSCTVCGEAGILRENIPRHMDCVEGDCPLVIIKCQFEHLGCYFQDKRKNIGEHFRSANLHHMQLISMKLQQQEDFLARQQRQMIEVSEKCSQLTEQTDSLKRMLSEQGEVIQVQASCIHELESTYSFDGRLLWRLSIPTGNDGIFTSPSFYTGRPGYKVNLVLDTSEAVGEDAVVYLNIEDGQFDHLLQFPFNGITRVTIFDQFGGKNNSKSSFECNINKYKPTGDTTNSVAASKDELPKLMKKTQLFKTPYTKNDALLMLIHVNQDVEHI